MNVADLKRILDKYPDDLEVYAACEGYGNLFPLDFDDIRVEVSLKDKNTFYLSIMTER